MLGDETVMPAGGDAKMCLAEDDVEVAPVDGLYSAGRDHQVGAVVASARPAGVRCLERLAYLIAQCGGIAPDLSCVRRNPQDSGPTLLEVPLEFGHDLRRGPGEHRHALETERGEV